MRAVLTGMVLGGTLAACNIYSGLLLGWSNNMSITGALLAFAFWRLMESTARTRPFTMLENNVNQAGASAGAAISSAGLVAAIPALTVLTGRELSWPLLALWTFSVCMVGIAVAIGLRRQMVIVDKLPFPSGIATAETLKQMYAAGVEAMARVKALMAAALLAASLKVAETVAHLPKLPFPGSYSGRAGTVTMGNLTFAVEPSVLMVGVGALIGTRAAVSLLLGALVAWGALAPYILGQGWVAPGKPGTLWFTGLVQWLLWPGVAMMVTSSLTSFAFSWRSIANSFRPRRVVPGAEPEDTGEVKRKWFLTALGGALVLSVICQVTLFGIPAWAAALGVLFTFAIAIVAARVAGETNITPIGAMGKITQLIFGVLVPGQVAPNLMAANVTGGAASQCADLMHDLKTGWLIGATPRHQVVGQMFGALAGAMGGSAVYLILIPDPQTQLFTAEWPAPAVQTWKAVAELFQKGLAAIPPGTLTAMVIAGMVGILLAIAEKTLPARVRRWVPSPSAAGLAFVVPAHNSIMLFLGGMIALVLGKAVPTWSGRFVVACAAGFIAGESLAGVGLALHRILDR